MKTELDDVVGELKTAYDECSDEGLKQQSIDKFRKVGGTVTKDKQFSISPIDITKAQGTFDAQEALQGDPSQITSAINAIRSIAREMAGNH